MGLASNCRSRLMAPRSKESTCRLFLGAFTTFSTLSLETYRLLVRGHVVLAIAYSLGTLAAGLLALTLGVALGRMA
jgi:fluoride ion exporter CrcB/FEX